MQNTQTTERPRISAQALQQAIQSAWLHQQSNRAAQAESICHQIIQILPVQADALHLLGVIALQDGNIEVAVNYLTKAIRHKTDNPQFFSNLGLAYHEKGQPELAARYYRQALAIEPDYADAHYNLHALMLDAGDMQSAIACLQRVLLAQPQDLDARLTLGVLLDYVVDTEKAGEHFAIIEQGPALFRARLDAWRYIKTKNAALPIVGSNLKTFELAMAAAECAGLILEFGVRHGNSIRQIAGLAGRDTVHGFDSFEGLPELWHHEPKGSYTTKGQVPAVPHNVKLHVGWFEHTLPQFLAENPGNARLINIDCDIYSSTQTVLDLLAPRIVTGTVIIFDEYIGNEHWREDEFKAFQEALEKNDWRYEYLCFSMFTKQVAVRITSA